LRLASALRQQPRPAGQPDQSLELSCIVYDETHAVIRHASIGLKTPGGIVGVDGIVSLSPSPFDENIDDSLSVFAE
jgi:hypothetical protein